MMDKVLAHDNNLLDDDLEQTISTDRKYLRNARMIALNYSPVSEEALELCTQLSDKVTRADPKRSRQRRGEKKKKFGFAIGAFVTDLMLGYRRAGVLWSYRPKSSNSFSDEKVSYRHFESLERGFYALRLIEKLPGFYERAEDGMGSRGFATRYLPTQKLIRYVSLFGLTPENINQHFQHSLPRHPLELRQPSSRRGREKIRGKKIKFVSTAETETLESEVQELNKFIETFEITGGTHRGFRRIFNEGRSDAYRWNKGGRLTSIGDDSYQQLKQKLRAKILINAESTIELDIRASHFTILQSKLGLNQDKAKDPYEVPGLTRDIAKAWIKMTLGYDKFHSRWPDNIKAEFEKKDINIVIKYPLKKVKSLILDYYPMMANWPEYPIDCFDLMYSESEAIIDTMLDLKRTYAIPSLPVHDSLIVRKKDQKITLQSLKTHYLKACGVEPVIK